jgi:hypothetical protein
MVYSKDRRLYKVRTGVREYSLFFVSIMKFVLKHCVEKSHFIVKIRRNVAKKRGGVVKKGEKKG